MYTDADLIVVNSKERRDRIIEYILLNQGCSKSKVVSDATENGYGSKVSVYEILDDLEREKILSIHRIKPNSKTHQLFIDRDNSVVMLGKQTKEIDLLLKKLLDRISSIYYKPVKDWPYIYDRHQSPIQLSEIIYALSHLVIFIDHAFRYRYNLEWPKYDSNYRDQLYTTFFLEIGKWHNLVNNHISTLIRHLENQMDEWIIPNKRFEYNDSRSLTPLDLNISLLQPLSRIHLLESTFERHGALNEFTKLIDYLFSMNISEIDSVYLELWDTFFDIFDKNTSYYLEKYRERFKREYKEYLVKNGLDE